MDARTEKAFSKQTMLFLCIAALILASFWVGGYVKTRQYDRYFDQTKNKRITNDPYNLVAPLIGSDSPSAIQIGRLIGVDKAVNTYIGQHKDDVDMYSVYYRDLDTSQWFGINEDEGYIPASLLKIALAISFLKQEEENPAFRRIDKVYTQKIAAINTSMKFLEPTELTIGNSYSTESLLRMMMIDSDNGAKDLLYSVLNKTYFYDLFRLLGIKQPRDALSYTLSTKDYAFFLRMLYNGTYLTPEDSQKLLEIMTKSKFTDGLVAGVPPEVTVAHKYGTYTLTDGSGNRNGVELHDCGIVYKDTHPFILCVMTKGSDADKLAGFIAGVASTTYDAVGNYFGK